MGAYKDKNGHWYVSASKLGNRINTFDLINFSGLARTLVVCYPAVVTSVVFDKLNNAEAF